MLYKYPLPELPTENAWTEDPEALDTSLSYKAEAGIW
jgi:hypothetical protein